MAQRVLFLVLRLFMLVFVPVAQALVPAACLAAPGDQRTTSIPGAREIEIPAWFKASFLDLPQDVAEAVKSNHRVMVYFGQDGCPYCKKLMEVSFRDPQIVRQMRQHFDAIALNTYGALEVTWMDGKIRSEKDLARALDVRFTPTLLFLDEKGRVALRLTGYYPPAKLRVALDYVANKMEGSTSFPDYLAKNYTVVASDGVHAGPASPADQDAAASPSDIVVRRVNAEFDDVKERVTMAIENRGLVITYTANVGEMLDRTGKDIGRTKPIYSKAEVYEFCSAGVSRDAMEADPRNIALCPYGIAVYALSNESGKAYVAYRRPRLAGTAASIKALKEIEQLLEGIAREALQ